MYVVSRRDLYDPPTGNVVPVVIGIVGRGESPSRCLDVVSAAGIDLGRHLDKIIRPGWNHFGRVL